MPAEKPIQGLWLTDVTGTCSKAIRLANAVGVKLQNINVTGFTGPLLETENVTGTGLEGAVRPSTTGIQQLMDSFIHPPDDARPQVRWWWFGPAVTKPELAREIDTMKAGGFGGFEVQPTYPLAVDGQPAGLVNLKFLSPGVSRRSEIRFRKSRGNGHAHGSDPGKRLAVWRANISNHPGSGSSAT